MFGSNNGKLLELQAVMGFDLFLFSFSCYILVEWISGLTDCCFEVFAEVFIWKLFTQVCFTRPPVLKVDFLFDFSVYNKQTL